MNDKAKRLALINVLMQSINTAMNDRIGLIVSAETDEEFRRELAFTLTAHADALTEQDRHRIGFRP